MIFSYFKNIGLSIAFLFTSIGSIFHKPKPVKTKTDLSKDIIASSDFIITKTFVEKSMELVFVKSIKEQILEHEAILEKLYKERTIERKANKKKKKEKKDKRKKDEYEQWKKDQRQIMNEIDIRIARSPKEMQKLEVWHLTDEEMDKVISKPNRLEVVTKNIEEPNNIFE